MSQLSKSETLQWKTFKNGEILFFHRTGCCTLVYTAVYTTVVYIRMHRMVFYVSPPVTDWKLEKAEDYCLLDVGQMLSAE